MATRMLLELTTAKIAANGNPRLIELVTTYHIARLRKSLDAQSLKENALRLSRVPRLNRSGRYFFAPSLRSPVPTLLAKAGLGSSFRTAGVLWDPASTAAYRAHKLLPGIVEQTCVVCPCTGTVNGRGIEAVVKHVRERHGYFFWGDNTRGSWEAEFQILG